MRTIATLFSGGGGFDVGAMAAGLRPVWAVEIEGPIADVYERNVGPHVIRASVSDVDYAGLERPYWLHMSPPCTRASVANTGASEDPLDVEMARGCIRAIEALRPVVVSLENVWGYRNFEAFRLILRALTENGYAADFWHLNSADYGVAQTRRRLILLASRERVPRKPAPTHHDPSDETPGQLALFPRHTRPWVGWYEAIEDLIPALPESRFAKWQLERLPALFVSTLVGQQYDRPAGSPERRPQTAAAHEPAMVVTASLNAKGKMPHAFVVSSQSVEGGEPAVRNGQEPAVTVGTNAGRVRAFIVDCQEAGTPDADGNRGLTIRREDEPVFTVLASASRKPARAWLAQGRVVRMTPRALARFQSFEDDYELPAKTSLATRIIGNAVPPLWARRIVESTTP